MTKFLKQIVLMALVIAAFAVLRHRAPVILPAPLQQYIHGQQIRLPVATGAPLTANSPSWSLVQTKHHTYEVFVRYKGQIKGKFDAGTKIASSASGQDFSTAGKAEFGAKTYNASIIHVNPDGRSGFITFINASRQPSG
ncbi:hypothetical protein [Alicyclobacillus sp. SO9]|uniref:hypothetical protein n=1 Tax=Alicyclobacillus sp. SO9 TaxID=2665646 RepID=UPI0018E8903B|nr:hypothetical protein [Alicyclobacillus sp. SO9]QQE80231.1 hypothetical protein GI364_07330 [Alicyclobacillus sp. SO9]